MNNIITPTFAGHFPNVEIYLKSFAEYAEREPGWQIVFTISAEEKEAFLKLLEPYEESLPIKVVIFEDLLEQFGIDLSPEELLRLYGKFSFQTLKKFYTMLSLEGRRSLVLDSETELVRPVSVNALFERFFADPFISCSSLGIRTRISSFTKNVVANRNLIFGTDDDHWFLENFVWFYDKTILADLFERHGTPFEIVDRIRRTGNPARKECGIFEIDLYQSFIYINNAKYGYRIVDVERFLDGLGDAERTKYLSDWTKKFDGNCGLVEHALMLLTQENAGALAHCFKESRFDIIRCESSTFRNCRLQKRFLDDVRPCILAASQDHFFGISDFAAENNKYAVRTREAARRWADQLEFLFGLVVNPLKIVLNVVKSFIFKLRFAAFRKTLKQDRA